MFLYEPEKKLTNDEELGKNREIFIILRFKKKHGGILVRRMDSFLSFW